MSLRLVVVVLVLGLGYEIWIVLVFGVESMGMRFEVIEICLICVVI